MTPEEIRKERAAKGAQLEAIGEGPGAAKLPVWLPAAVVLAAGMAALYEIAAQLAEMNERASQKPSGDVYWDVAYRAKGSQDGWDLMDQVRLSRLEAEKLLAREEELAGKFLEHRLTRIEVLEES